MVVAARRQTAAFIQEIESSGFLPKAARQNSIVPAAQNLFSSITSHFVAG
jgi:hypothetical protein